MNDEIVVPTTEEVISQYQDEINAEAAEEAGGTTDEPKVEADAGEETETEESETEEGGETETETEETERDDEQDNSIIWHGKKLTASQMNVLNEERQLAKVVTDAMNGDKAAADMLKKALGGDKVVKPVKNADGTKESDSDARLRALEQKINDNEQKQKVEASNAQIKANLAALAKEHNVEDLDVDSLLRLERLAVMSSNNGYDLSRNYKAELKWIRKLSKDGARKMVKGAAKKAKIRTEGTGGAGGVLKPAKKLDLNKVKAKAEEMFASGELSFESDD